MTTDVDRYLREALRAQADGIPVPERWCPVAGGAHAVRPTPRPRPRRTVLSGVGVAATLALVGAGVLLVRGHQPSGAGRTVTQRAAAVVTADPPGSYAPTGPSLSAAQLRKAIAESARLGEPSPTAVDFVVVTDRSHIQRLLAPRPATGPTVPAAQSPTTLAAAVRRTTTLVVVRLYGEFGVDSDRRPCAEPRSPRCVPVARVPSVEAYLAFGPAGATRSAALADSIPLGGIGRVGRWTPTASTDTARRDPLTVAELAMLLSMADHPGDRVEAIRYVRNPSGAESVRELAVAPKGTRVLVAADLYGQIAGDLPPGSSASLFLPARRGPMRVFIVTDPAAGPGGVAVVGMDGSTRPGVTTSPEVPLAALGRVEQWVRSGAAGFEPPDALTPTIRGGCCPPYGSSGPS